MSLIDDFFQDLDRGWSPTSPERIRLPIIGSTALLLQTDYERRTKDSDVLETAEIDQTIRAQLLTLAGQGSQIHRRRQVYLEVVASGLPFLPQRPNWMPITGLSADAVRAWLRKRRGGGVPASRLAEWFKPETIRRWQRDDPGADIWKNR